MVTRVITYNNVTNACGAAELTPYPAVVAGTGATVTSVTAPTGLVTYTVNVVPLAPDDDQVISAANTSIVVVGPTGPNNNFTVGANISPAAGNGLTLTPTGLFVAADDNQIVSATNNSIVVVGPTGANNDFAVSANISPTIGNNLSLTANGLFVPAICTMLAGIPIGPRIGG